MGQWTRHTNGPESDEKFGPRRRRAGPALPAWAAGKLVSGKPLLKLVYMPQIRTESSFLQNYQNKISRIDIFLHILPTTLSCVELDVSERRYT